jgi:hypothetical protein
MSCNLTYMLPLSLVIAFTLCGCEPSVPRGPLGRITLTYLGTSGSDMHFLLDNRTDHAIHFSRATKLFGKDAAPWYTHTVCTQGNGEMSIGLFPPLDYDFHPISLTLLPEHRLRLSYDKRLLGPMDGKCHLELKSDSGDEIQSLDIS